VRTKGRFLYEKSQKTYEKGAKFAQTLCLFREFFVSSTRKLSCQVRANFVSFSQVFRVKFAQTLHEKLAKKGRFFRTKKGEKRANKRAIFVRTKGEKSANKRAEKGRFFRTKKGEKRADKRAIFVRKKPKNIRKRCKIRANFVSFSHVFRAKFAACTQTDRQTVAISPRTHTHRARAQAFEKCWAHSLLRAAVTLPVTICR